MRKWILLLVMVLLIPFAVKSWALPDNCIANEYSGSQTIKSTSGFTYSVNVSGAGVTVGDKVQLIDGGASGTVRFTCIASSANGSLNCPNSSVANVFNTSIYLKETKTSGTFYTDIQFF